MIDIERIQKLYTMFENNQGKTTIKSVSYDIILEKSKFADNFAILMLQSHKPIDLNYTLQKITEYKYSKFQVSVHKNIIHISYNIDIKHLTINLLFDTIFLMEKLI